MLDETTNFIIGLSSFLNEMRKLHFDIFSRFLENMMFVQNYL